MELEDQKEAQGTQEGKYLTRRGRREHGRLKGNRDNPGRKKFNKNGIGEHFCSGSDMEGKASKARRFQEEKNRRPRDRKRERKGDGVISFPCVQMWRRGAEGGGCRVEEEKGEKRRKTQKGKEEPREGVRRIVFGAFRNGREGRPDQEDAEWRKGKRRRAGDGSGRRKGNAEERERKGRARRGGKEVKQTEGRKER